MSSSVVIFSSLEKAPLCEFSPRTFNAKAANPEYVYEVVTLLFPILHAFGRMYISQFEHL